MDYITMENTEATLKYLADRLEQKSDKYQKKEGSEGEKILNTGVAMGLLLAKMMILEYKKTGKTTEDGKQ